MAPANSIPNLLATEERTCSKSNISPSISDDLTIYSVIVFKTASSCKSKSRDSIFPNSRPCKFLVSANFLETNFSF